MPAIPTFGGIMPTQSQATTNPQDFLETVLPGFKGMSQSASSNIGNLLNGLPSPSQARTANSYWGVGAGTPAGGAGGGGIDTFIGQRGTDLYGQQAQQNQQLGLQNLLSTVGAFSSPALANQGQQLQNQQAGASIGLGYNQLYEGGRQFDKSQAQQLDEFNRNLNQNAGQFQQTHQLNQFEAMLQALGLGNNIVGQLPGNITI